MGVCSLRLGLLLLCWPAAGLADEAVLRVTALPEAPALAAGPAGVATGGREQTVSRLWLHAPRNRTDW
jgi:hypothetical protein